MSSSNIKLNDRILDELVSGNLRGEQYRAVLLALEESPNLWRNCALAFLQEQAISQDLKSLCDGNIDWSPHEKSTALTPTGAIMPRPNESPRADVLTRNPMLDYSSLDPQLWMRRIAILAALLLVSFTVGWFGAGIRDSLGSGELPGLTNAGVLGDNSTAQRLSPEESSDDRLPTIPNQAVFGSDQFQPIDQHLALQLRELQKAGRIQIETIESIVPVRLEDGSSIIVPVQQYRITPVAYSY